MFIRFITTGGTIDKVYFDALSQFEVGDSPLDPIYTGKAMSAMLDMLKKQNLRNARDVVFLHTGGAPAIHPYADFLRS
jgi:1-aminocyclopropane-1-carboxylate deaminase/D-cysteine desulfhydrase-like pyridoxal-dependent ACC family enzyme